MRGYNRTIVTVFIVIASALTISAQTKKVKVDISVVADSQLKTELTDYLKRELISTGNVDVVPINKGDYGFHVYVNKIPSENTDVRYVLTYSLNYWIKCQDEYHFASLAEGLTITDKAGMRKTLQQWVGRNFAPDGLRLTRPS